MTRFLTSSADKLPSNSLLELLNFHVLVMGNLVNSEFLYSIFLSLWVSRYRQLFSKRSNLGLVRVVCFFFDD